MKPKGLLVAVVLLAVMGGLVLWSNKKQAAAGKSTDTTIKMLTIPDDQFQEIRLKKPAGDAIDLKRENGKWQLVEPHPMRADQDTVGSMVSTLSSLSADKVVEDKATDLKPYGLADPAVDVQVARKDGKKDEVLIGDDVPTGSGAYAKIAGDPRVFTIASYVKTSIDKQPDDLRDKRMLTFDSEKLSRVVLEAKGKTVEFGKNAANEWQIVKPAPMRADNSAVDTLVGKLRDAKMDLTETDAAKKFAAATKVATAIVTDASGNQTLEVRRDKDKNVFAKSTAVEGTYKVNSDLADGLEKEPESFRSKKLFDFGFSDPTKVEIKGVTYIKSGDKWMSGAKTMDNISVQTLIDRLRDLSAFKFADKDGGDFLLEATVTSNSGKRVEKVTIRRMVDKKEGDLYFAQRENDPSIYQLEIKTVADLQQAAGDVKEAAPPGKKK